MSCARLYNIVRVKRYVEPEKLCHSFFENIHHSFYGFCSLKEYGIVLDEIPDPNNETLSLPELDAAKVKEIASLLAGGTLKVILCEDIPLDDNVLTGRFVLAIKTTSDGKVVFKARCIIGGHR